MRSRRWSGDLLEAAGAVCLVVGVALLSVAAAWVVGGVLLVVKAQLDPPGRGR